MTFRHSHVSAASACALSSTRRSTASICEMIVQKCSTYLQQTTHQSSSDRQQLSPPVGVSLHLWVIVSQWASLHASPVLQKRQQNDFQTLTCVSCFWLRVVKQLKQRKTLKSKHLQDDSSEVQYISTTDHAPVVIGQTAVVAPCGSELALVGHCVTVGVVARVTSAAKASAK